MRVLITGATGFVGRRLAAALADGAAPVTALLGTTRGDEALPGVALLHADLGDPGEVAEAVAAAQPDVVFHLAGFASGGGTDRDAITAANVGGTRNLLEALAATGRPCRVQLASTGYLYGDTSPLGRPAREDDPVAARGAYAESKAAMERMAADFAGRGGLSLVVTRAFNHTGSHQSPDFVTPSFARQIARIEAGLEPPVVRVGNLAAVRDFLDVRDVVDAYIRLLLGREPEPWRVVNVASGVPVTIRSVLDRLVAAARTDVEVEVDPTRLRPIDLAECVGDPGQLEALTGWRPQWSLEQTLAETLDWWRSQTRA